VIPVEISVALVCIEDLTLVLVWEKIIAKSAQKAYIQEEGTMKYQKSMTLVARCLLKTCKRARDLHR
jgi:hypothetical protein